MDKDDISKANREARNEVAPIHGRIHYDRLLKGFSTPGYSCIGGIKQQAMLAHGLSGKAVFQPCCNNGRDLLSIKNLGAKRCFGFDLADEFIKQGKQLARAGNIECELIQADVYHLGHEYDCQFDIAYITAGTLRCLSDITAFFAVILRLMKPGAWLFMQEMHPILDMYSMEPSKKPGSSPRHSYFMKNAYQSTRGLDYYSAKSYRAKPCYRFHHKLSDIIVAVLTNGLLIETFEERDNDTSGGTFAILQRKDIRLPLSYTLTANRPLKIQLGLEQNFDKLSAISL